MGPGGVQQIDMDQPDMVDETISSDHTKGKEAAIWQPLTAGPSRKQFKGPEAKVHGLLLSDDTHETDTNPYHRNRRRKYDTQNDEPRKYNDSSPPSDREIDRFARQVHSKWVSREIVESPRSSTYPPAIPSSSRFLPPLTPSNPQALISIVDPDEEALPKNGVSVSLSSNSLHRKRNANTPPIVHPEDSVLNGHNDGQRHPNDLQPAPNYSPVNRLLGDHVVGPSSSASLNHNDHIMRLEDEIRRLRAANLELRNLLSSERLAHRWVVIHRTSDATDSTASRYCLDKPEWCKSQSGTWTLQGQDYVRDFPRFVDRQKGTDVAFIAIFDHASSGRDMPPKGSNEQPRSCSVLILCEVLNDAFQQIFDLRPHLRQYKEHVSMERYDEVAATTLQNLDAFFYHFSAQIQTACRAIESQNLRQQLELLISFIMSVFARGYAKADSHFSKGIVSQETVRYLFEPGALLVHNEKGSVKGLRQTFFMNEYADEHRWNIQAVHWTCQSRLRKILDFYSLPFKELSWQPSRIDGLSIYPLKYADKRIQDLLRRRGETLWACRSPTYVLYHGLNMSNDTSHSNARFMIDMKTYRKLHPMTSLGQPIDILPDDELFELDTEAETAVSPPDDDFVYMTQQNIYGFNMAEKNWENLNLDCIIPNHWDKSSFHTLAIDNQSKELITALVTNKIATDQSTDYIANKGTGLILLLHGGPGTGKTLTAESVAEFAEKPLYRVTCGDIGTEPRQVESYLEKVFYLGKIWGCVVLLDEADVFLEQRTLMNLDRNALVSVFLRTLEYYDGILILTSNRVGTFDEAFKSRIQLALHYQNLDYGQRKQIWENFITRLQSLNELIDVDEILPNCGKLAAKHEINGRQIRNAITTARQLALYKKEPLNMAHLEHSIAVSGKFDKYLLDVHQVKDDEMAREDGIR